MRECMHVKYFGMEFGIKNKVSMHLPNSHILGKMQR